MDTPSRPLFLAILSDHPLVVAGLSLMMGDNAHRVRMVSFEDRSRVRDVDIVLLDTSSTLARGLLGLIRQVRAPGVKVVVFSWDTSPASVSQAMTAGAAGYLYQGLAADDLVEALEAIHCGNVVTRVPRPGQRPGPDPVLSVREAEVVALIAMGLSNEAIADTLSLSMNTVKTYIRSAYRKMDVTSRTQAVLWLRRRQ